VGIPKDKFVAAIEPPANPGYKMHISCGNSIGEVGMDLKYVPAPRPDKSWNFKLKNGLEYVIVGSQTPEIYGPGNKLVNKGTSQPRANWRNNLDSIEYKLTDTRCAISDTHIYFIKLAEESIGSKMLTAPYTETSVNGSLKVQDFVLINGKLIFLTEFGEIKETAGPLTSGKLAGPKEWSCLATYGTSLYASGYLPASKTNFYFVLTTDLKLKNSIQVVNKNKSTAVMRMLPLVRAGLRLILAAKQWSEIDVLVEHQDALHHITTGTTHTIVPQKDEIYTIKEIDGEVFIGKTGGVLHLAINF
jgi:hypothetical protein